MSDECPGFDGCLLANALAESSFRMPQQFLRRLDVDPVA